jgi:hypothetical protein
MEYPAVGRNRMQVVLTVVALYYCSLNALLLQALLQQRQQQLLQL